MNGKSINLNDKKIKKTEFYQNKKTSNIDDIDVNKVLVSKKEQYAENNSFIFTLSDIMIMMLLDHYV